MKRTACLLCLLVLLPVLSGCWDSHELDTMLIVTGLGLDAAPEPAKVDVSVQIAPVEAKASGGGGSGGSGGGDGAQSIIMEAAGKTVLDSLEMLRHRSSRLLFLHHNQMIVLGRGLAQQGIKEYLDIFLRNEETRMETIVLVSDGTAKDVLTAQPDQGTNTGDTLTRLIREEEDVSPLLNTDLLHLISKVVGGTIAPVVPIVKVLKGEKKSQMEIASLAVFQGDRMVGELNWEETMGYLWAMGGISDSKVTLALDQGSAVMSIVSGKSIITPVLSADGQPAVGLKLDVTLDMEEVNGFGSLTLQSLNPLLMAEASRLIHTQVLNCYQKTQQLDADIYGFGECFHRKYTAQWKQLKQRWNEAYAAMPIDVSVRVTIVSTGKAVKTMDMEESSK